MADNPNGPATAPASGGTPGTTPSTAPAGEPSLKEVMATVKTLTDAFTKKSGEWDNLRSLHDRQMTEIRNALSGKGGGGTRQEETDGGESAAAPAPAAGRPITARELGQMRDTAILKFRGEFPDWQEYWKDIEDIGSDAVKSRRFVRYTTDPETGEMLPDFHASLVDIREHLELQRTRAAKAAANPANQASEAAKNQARADAGAIGGSAASIPPDALGPDFKKLPYNEKIKKLYELGLLDIDPSDPPEALR
jgi:hypothetical protein